MGWKGALRSGLALSRRIERDSRRRQRELERRQKERHKIAQTQRNSLEVAAYNNYIERLTSIHKESSEWIDWEAIRAGVDRSRSHHIRHELEELKPGFMTRWKLEGKLQKALDEEARANLADAILGGEREAYEFAVEWSRCLSELSEMGLEPHGHFPYPFRAEMRLFVARIDAVVPQLELTLTSAYDVSRRPMTKVKSKAVYLEFVAGTVIRAARELHSVLPLHGVLVHADSPVLNRANGHMERHCILSSYVPREAMNANFTRVSAPAFVEQLVHRTHWTRGGLAPVEPLTWSELGLVR